MLTALMGHSEINSCSRMLVWKPEDEQLLVVKRCDSPLEIWKQMKDGRRGQHRDVTALIVR